MDPNANSSIGRHCLERRKQLKLTQDLAAVEAGIARRYVSEIENDKFRGALWILKRYLQLLQLELTVRSRKTPTWDELEELFSDED